MKKFLSLVLAAVLLFTLAACSGKEENNSTGTDAETTAESTAPVQDETTQPASEPVSEPAEEDEVVFTGAAVADNKFCSIRITDIKEEYSGSVLTVEVENKTADMNLIFTTKSCSINGIATDTAYSESVSAGEKSTGDITFLNSTLKENGITKYTDIEITFRVYDADNWIGDDLVNETVRIYPYGESKADSYEREEKETDIEIFKNDKACATVIGYGEDEVHDYYISLYLENKSSDTDYTFGIDVCAVNGVEIKSSGAFTVPSGKVALEKFYITEAALTESGITDITDIFLDMQVYNADSWDDEYIADASVNIYPEGKDKAIAYVREAKDTDTVIADNSDVSIIITGLSDDDMFSCQNLNFYFINKTDKELMFTIEEVSVNGNMMDPFFATSVLPGFSKFSDASWFDEDLTENGIDEITEIVFTMIVRPENDWDSDDILNEKVTYTLVSSDEAEKDVTE